MIAYFKTHIWAITLQKVSHQRTMIRYINVIDSSRQTKEGMPYPQSLIYKSFQYNGVFALSILKSSLPWKRTIIPPIVHRVQWCKHIRLMNIVRVNMCAKANTLLISSVFRHGLAKIDLWQSITKLIIYVLWGHEYFVSGVEGRCTLDDCFYLYTHFF